MFKIFLIFAIIGSKLLPPLLEVGINVWNSVSIDRMVKDPESGYGNEFIFESLWSKLNPLKIVPYPPATLVPYPWASLTPFIELEPFLEIENTTGKM